MGVGDVPSVPSLALGSGEVTLQSMTAAYAAFANHGIVPQPIADSPRRGSRRPRAVSSRRRSRPRARSATTTAFLMSTMMADVINAGTAARARSWASRCRRPARPARPTTSTTPGSSAITPKLVAGVWVGFDQPHTILPNGFAADVAVPLWAKFMKTATKGQKPEWFTLRPAWRRRRLPDVGQACDRRLRARRRHRRGRSARRKSMVYTEYFARGTQPTATLRHPRTSRRLRVDYKIRNLN